jgi:hypothetical protein
MSGLNEVVNIQKNGKAVVTAPAARTTPSTATLARRIKLAVIV